MYCPSCGDEITDQSAFCRHCGTSVDDGWTETTNTTTRSHSDMTQKPTESVSQARETSSTSRGIDQNRSTTSSHSKEAGGLGNNGAAALAYGFGFFTGLVMYLITDDEFVRFHSVQSMLVFATLLPLSIGLSIVQFFLRLFPVIGGILATTLSIFSTLLGPVTGILWLVLIYKAYQGERYHLPVVGDVAERFA